MNWLKIVHIGIVFFYSCNLFGQELTSNQDKIHMLAKVSEDKQSVLLRWAPSNPIIWEYGLKYGYRLEKYLVMQGDSLLYPPVNLSVEQNLFKPAPPSVWENIIDTNDYAAIAAQAIYGETFEVTQSSSSDIVKIIQKVRESEQRFSFNLFSADQSFLVAQTSGLGYVDSRIEKGEKYLYRIYSNAPSNVIEADTGFFYIGVEDYIELPKPDPPHVKYSNGTVLLSWDAFHLKEFYNSYIVEKSDDDGTTFNRISNQPFITTSNGKRPSHRFYKMDSITDKNKTYYYRIRGVTAFGETGPCSDAVQAEMKIYVRRPAIINKYEVIDNSHVLIRWEYAESAAYLSKFSLLRSTQANTGFDVLIDSIHLSKRKITDNAPYTTGYYKIRTYDRYGTHKDSFPVLVQLEDSISPAVPIGFTHTIDTVGRVKINWVANNENDFLGYHVYRSNFKNQEFSRITVEPIVKPAFSDTLNIRTLSDKIYYTVTAVDNRFNESEYAQPIEIERPDIIAPVPPVFTSITFSGGGGIKLKWINSSSEDVMRHVLYRTEGKDNWHFVASVSDSIFIDTNINPGQQYQYTLIAIDDANLESDPAQAISLRVPENWNYPPVKEISYKIDRGKKRISIHWKYDQPNVLKYYIYRKKNDEPFSLYKTVNASEYYDLNVSYGNSYSYRVKAIFKNGTQSQFSEKILVNY